MLGPTCQVQEPAAKRARTEPGPTMEEDAEAGPAEEIAVRACSNLSFQIIWLKRLKSGGLIIKKIGLISDEDCFFHERRVT